jgi:hypothetical protein
VAEELRLFLRTGVWVVLAGVAYWIVSSEPAGTVLLFFLLVAILAFVFVGAAFAPETIRGLRGSRPMRLANRLIGFEDRTDEPAPMRSDPGVVPLASAWPVITAAALVVVGLGFIFGTWLLLPGVALLIVGGLGWLTQLDR